MDVLGKLQWSCRRIAETNRLALKQLAQNRQLRLLKLIDVHGFTVFNQRYFRAIVLDESRPLDVRIGILGVVAFHFHQDDAAVATPLNTKCTHTAFAPLRLFARPEQLPFARLDNTQNGHCCRLVFQLRLSRLPHDHREVLRRGGSQPQRHYEHPMR
jgi:hypothetical protein